MSKPSLAETLSELLAAIGSTKRQHPKRNAPSVSSVPSKTMQVKASNEIETLPDLLAFIKSSSNPKVLRDVVARFLQNPLLSENYRDLVKKKVQEKVDEEKRKKAELKKATVEASSIPSTSSSKQTNLEKSSTPTSSTPVNIGNQGRLVSPEKVPENLQNSSSGAYQGSFLAKLKRLNSLDSSDRSKGEESRIEDRTTEHQSADQSSERLSSMGSAPQVEIVPSQEQRIAPINVPSQELSASTMQPVSTDFNCYGLPPPMFQNPPPSGPPGYQFPPSRNPSAGIPSAPVLGNHMFAGYVSQEAPVSLAPASFVLTERDRIPRTPTPSPPPTADPRKQPGVIVAVISDSGRLIMPGAQICRGLRPQFQPVTNLTEPPPPPVRPQLQPVTNLTVPPQPPSSQAYSNTDLAMEASVENAEVVDMSMSSESESDSESDDIRDDAHQNMVSSNVNSMSTSKASPKPAGREEKKISKSKARRERRSRKRSKLFAMEKRRKAIDKAIDNEKKRQDIAMEKKRKAIEKEKRRQDKKQKKFEKYAQKYTKGFEPLPKQKYARNVDDTEDYYNSCEPVLPEWVEPWRRNYPSERSLEEGEILDSSFDYGDAPTPRYPAFGPRGRWSPEPYVPPPKLPSLLDLTPLKPKRRRRRLQGSAATKCMCSSWIEFHSDTGACFVTDLAGDRSGFITRCHSFPPGTLLVSPTLTRCRAMSRLIHLHFNKFLLLLVIWSSSVAADDCPILPSTCVCNKEATGRISITCDGAHLPSLFKDIGGASIDRLRISKCAQPVVDVLPTGPIRSLALTNCQITTINPEIFRSVESTLEELNLSNNSLKNVPLLGNMSQLRSLNLFGNKVKEVPEGVFSGLSQLRMLRLENNEICSLSPTSLSEVKQKIELLDLSGNCFASVPAQALRNSIKLMYLDLSDNKISEINNFELMNLPQLKELRLQNNQLHEIHPMAFMNVPQLQYLYLKDNLIGSLDGNRLQAFHRLEILDVTNNLLLKLPELKDLTSLKQVRLDGNLIEKIDTLAFSNNPNLQLISIQDNNIAQIAKNSFDSLDQLMVLLLSNNSIQKLERGMLDGMRNLQQLNLRNNSLTAVDEYSFASLRFLTTLDLAHNELVKIGKRTFSHQSKLFWLDLSNNKLTGFEEGTFDTKIANLLLDGNHLICDDDFDWFVRYLVTNRVRTFLPFQTEITCAGPEKYAGVRLKDLMIKKANDTLTEGMRSLGFNSDQSQNSLLSALLPGFRPPPAASANGGGALGQAAAGLPILSTLSQAIPSMRNMPGLDMTAAAAAAGGAQPANPNLNTAIEQFTAPLVRFATGGQPVQSDIEQLIQSIPNFVVNVPGMGNVDISKLDPNLIAHVLRGGQIPGIPKETLDGIVQQYMLKMHEAAAAAQNGAPLKNGSKDYYTARLPVPPAAVPERIPAMANTPPVQYTTRNTTAPPFVFSKELLDMLKILPVGYNLSKIPAEIITAFSRGEVPDLRKLPTDLIEHFKSNSEKLGLIFNRVAKANASLEEMLAKMPKFEKPVLSTFSPYDINHLSNDMIHEEEEAARAARMRVYTAIALGLVGAATVVILGFFAVYIKKQREAKERRGPMTTPRCAFPGAPLANSTMRNQPRSHSSSHLHLRTNT
ncbi:hypothetical protein V3C99_003890 [Haemonchus contortus]